MNLARLCARLKPVFLSKKGPSRARLLTKMSPSEELGTLLLLSTITSPTTREQMPPALHQGPVILHRRALPLAALTHLTHRVTQREETR